MVGCFEASQSCSCRQSLSQDQTQLISHSFSSAIFQKQLPIMDHSFAPMKNDLIIRAAWGEYLFLSRYHVTFMIHLI